MSRSVLIVKLAALGDVVMALPLVSALRRHDPGVRIDWMAGRQAAPLLACVDGIDRVIPVDEAALLAGSAAAKAWAVARAWTALAGRRYDTVYVAHSDTRYAMLGRGARAGERRQLVPRAGGRGLDPARLHADQYLDLLSLPPGSVPEPPAVRVVLAERLAAELPLDPGAPLVAITPGGARNVARENALRRWPLDRYAALAKRLRASGCRVVLVGDAGDAWVRGAFAPGDVIDLVGRTDLPQLVAVFRRCAAVVAHDSGPMHLARLAGAPVVALLGPTPPSMFFRPDQRALVLWPGAALPCAPCYDGLDFAPCADNRCMQMIDVDAAMARVQEALATSAGAR